MNLRRWLEEIGLTIGWTIWLSLGVLNVVIWSARALALGTFVGAAKLVRERGEDPAVLRAQVTSRGGTTERALAEMEGAALKARFVEAVKAARERSRELGEQFGKD